MNNELRFQDIYAGIRNEIVTVFVANEFVSNVVSNIFPITFHYNSVAIALVLFALS